MCVNSPAVAANSPISISWACGPTNPNSYVNLITPSQTGAAGQGINGGDGAPRAYWTKIGGAASGTTTLPAPNGKVDRDEPWYVGLYQDWTARNGGQVAPSSPVTVRESNRPALADRATLPTSLAADPFTPQHTNTVCASGCDFTNLGDAVHNAAANSWDFVKITISAGDYPYPQFALPTPADYPAHLWIRGISPDGKTFPHLFGITQSAGSVFFTNEFFTTGAASATSEILRLGIGTEKP